MLALAKDRRDLSALPARPPRRRSDLERARRPHSQVIPQAANRLHFQMALLIWLCMTSA